MILLTVLQSESNACMHVPRPVRRPAACLHVQPARDLHAYMTASLLALRLLLHSELQGYQHHSAGGAAPTHRKVPARAADTAHRRNNSLNQDSPTSHGAQQLAEGRPWVRHRHSQHYDEWDESVVDDGLRTDRTHLASE